MELRMPAVLASHPEQFNSQELPSYPAQLARPMSQRQPLHVSPGKSPAFSSIYEPLATSIYDVDYEQERFERHRTRRLGDGRHGRMGPVLSSIPPRAISTPPYVLASQEHDSTYTPPHYSRMQQRQQFHLRQRQRRNGMNPMWLSRPFQNYRKKQAEKDDKSDQKWPDILEDAFLDALLIIPKMGRRKFIMHRTQFGRNMLIGEYLWHAYEASLAPGQQPDPSMRRSRKQVSSHIQVLKNFFQHHRCFHFFFPGSKEDKGKDTVETESLKRNPVLIALSQHMLPQERPNYEYFACILAMHDQIVVKPKRNWIFVSHPHVSVKPDGSGRIVTTGQELDAAELPRMKTNLDREKWPMDEREIVQGALLHEFAKEMEQTESTSVKEVSQEWEERCPELHRRLEAVIAADSQCDLLHMHVAFEMKGQRRFPDASSLNSSIEITIERSQLHFHRWKVDTFVSSAPELSYGASDAEPDIKEVQYHRKDCAFGKRTDTWKTTPNCKCTPPRWDFIGVPFPADTWARIFSNAADYPIYPGANESESGASSSRRGAKRAKRDSDYDDDGLTQMDLVPQTAMMQEIWSAPFESSENEHSTSGAAPQWTRRAVILWTFETVHSRDDKGKIITASHGRTSWRFLTALDPTSSYHQQQVLVSAGAASGASTPMSMPRDLLMSPAPSYHPGLNAGVCDSLGAAWDAMPSSMSDSYHAGQVGMLDSTAGPTVSRPSTLSLLNQSFGSHHGLVTPPPTASTLTSSFHGGFDAAGQGPTSHGPAASLDGYMGTPSMATISAVDDQSLNSLTVVVDPFLTGGTAVTSAGPGAETYSSVGLYDHTSVGGWAGDGAWSAAGYVAATTATSSAAAANAAAAAHNSSLIDWPPPSVENKVSASWARTVGATAQHGHQHHHANNLWQIGREGTCDSQDWVHVPHAGPDTSVSSDWEALSPPESGVGLAKDDSLPGANSLRTVANNEKPLSVLDLAAYSLSPHGTRGTKRNRANSFEDRETYHPLRADGW